MVDCEKYPDDKKIDPKESEAQLIVCFLCCDINNKSRLHSGAFGKLE